MAYTELPTTILEGATDHRDHHPILHAKWNREHPQQVSTSQTLTDAYTALVVNSNTSGPTLTLPETTALDNHVYVIVRSGTNNVVVARSGSDTFSDAATSKTLASDGAAIGIMSIGDQTWYISGERGTVS